jgi:pyruvate formate lyase activating enzyme
MPDTGKGTVLRIEHASIHDGEGIQTVVFLKGCPLHCAWCSTPEGLGPQPLTTAAGKTYGRIMDADELMKEIEKDEVFFFHSGGGVTLSGGEALAQPEFVAEIFKRCHYLGIRTTLESSLHAAPEAIELVLPHLDLLYADVKHMDSGRHEEWTGLDNELILANIRAVSGHPRPPALIIRMPVVPSVNDDDENLRSLARFCLSLPGLKGVELLPYHRLGVAMYRELGRDYPLHAIKTPSREHMEAKAKVVRSVAPDLDVAIR